MKFYISLAIFAALAVAAISKEEAKGCHTQDNCDEDECCLVKGWIPYRKGECGKLTKEGKSCTAEEDIIGYFDKYMLHCPCEGELNCVPEETVIKGNSITKKNPKCVGPTTDESEETTTEGDDATEEDTTSGEDDNTEGESGESGEVIEE